MKEKKSGKELLDTLTKEVEAAERQKEVLAKLMKLWDEFAEHMVAAAEVWPKYQEVWQQTSSMDREMLPAGYQRYITKSFNRSKFNVLLPRLVDYWRARGGVHTLKVK